MKKFVTDFFPFILLVCCAIGMIFPDPGENISWLIVAFLFIVIFASFFQFSFSANLKTDALKAVLFSAIRYVALPFAFYFLVRPISEFYAYAFFFIAFLPAGVSSPAIADMLKGNFNLTVLTLAISSAIVLFTIPLFAPRFYESNAEISSWYMLRTLLVTLVAPFLLHLPFRKIKKMTTFIKSNLPIISVVSISTILVLVVASNKEYILNEPLMVLEYIGLSFVFFIVLYLFGFFGFFPFRHADRVSLSVSSGLDNLGLGVALSFLFLEKEYTVLFITAEIAWVCVLIPVKYILKPKKKKNG